MKKWMIAFGLGILSLTLWGCTDKFSFGEKPLPPQVETLDTLSQALPENSVYVMLRNTDVSRKALEKVKEQLLSFMKIAQEDLDLAENPEFKVMEKGLEEIIKGLKDTQEITFFLHLDPKGVKTFADTIEKGVSVEEILKDIPEGVCLRFKVVSKAETLKKLIEEEGLPIKEIQMALKDMDMGVSLDTEKGIYGFYLGCKEGEAMPQGKGLENTNVLVVDKQINKGFEAISQWQKENSEYADNKLVKRIEALTKKIEEELNSARILKAQQYGAYALSFTPKGYNVWRAESYPEASLRDIRKDFFEGQALQATFYTNKDSEVTSEIFTKEKDGAYQVYSEIRYENINWVHFIGKLEERIGKSAYIILPFAVGATIGMVEAMAVYQEQAKDALRRAATFEVKTALSMARAIESIDSFALSREEVLKVLREESGYIPPNAQALGGSCLFYAYDAEGENFAVFIDAKRPSPFPFIIRGTAKAEDDIRGYLLQHRSPLGCETPDIPGYTVINLSK